MTPREFKIKRDSEESYHIYLRQQIERNRILDQIKQSEFGWIPKSEYVHNDLIKEFRDSGWLITNGWFRTYISETPICWFDRLITPMLAGGIT